jgi:ribosomal protein S18 acetylase RimI-like enzyme
MSSEVTVRRHLRPGDLAAIVAQHGRLYAREYDVDARFEAHVAKSVAEAGIRGFPREREGIWIVEADGEHAGSIGLTDAGGGEAVVRWVVLEPHLRGRGLGRRLVGEVLAEARAAGYRLVSLETFSELTAAASIYRDFGFQLVWEETKPRWGRAEITYQRYELVLGDRLVKRPDDQRGEREGDEEVGGEPGGRGVGTGRWSPVPARKL